MKPSNAGLDLFLDESVRLYTDLLLRRFAQPALLARLDFDAPIPGLSSFYDL